MEFLLSFGSVMFLSLSGKGNMILAYEEFVDFLVGGTTPQSVLDYRPSDTTKARVADLLRRQKTTSLSLDETAELNQHLQIEHLMRLAKARARQRLEAR